MGDIMLRKVIDEVKSYLGDLNETDRINAINEIRQAIHELSPFNEHPVDCVLWVRQDDVTSNDYNPNNVAPQEMRLLAKSLEADGFTQPVVVSRLRSSRQTYQIIDGFHRHELGKCKKSLMLKGYLPVTCLREGKKMKSDHMAATIRHNRARGRHQITAMSDIVRELSLQGWDDKKIAQELGMDSDEVLRLKQINGLLEMFSGRHFSEAWTVK
ncbi:IbrB-like domain-containing protein [Enterobacter kobei]|uniref:IbrB-like domain-containing protein n=1 Tax=Enterobacter kobei TaxID=208224 RepID=UPI003CFB702B